MVDGNLPYVVPLNFGYLDNVLYFHSAKVGKKVEILKLNSNVCFEFDVDHELRKAGSACDWGMKYRSVIGFGTVSLIECHAEKIEALAIIMKQYSDSQHFEFAEAAVNKTSVFRIVIEKMTGKQAGY